MVVHGGTFKAGYLHAEHKKESYFLCGEGVAPGFDFNDFTYISAEELTERLALVAERATSGGNVEAEVERMQQEYVKLVKPELRRDFDRHYN
jgi:hypothetical protein